MNREYSSTGLVEGTSAVDELPFVAGIFWRAPSPSGVAKSPHVGLDPTALRAVRKPTTIPLKRS